jgi:hypothetical protein
MAVVRRSANLNLLAKMSNDEIRMTNAGPQPK